MRTSGLLLCALLAGCNLESTDFVEAIEDINNAGAKIQAREDAVVRCAGNDFRLVAPFFRAFVEGVLGDRPGPVRLAIELRDGTELEVEVTGMDGTGLVPGVPREIAWSIREGFGELRDGRMIVTLATDGTLLVTGSLGFPVTCRLFVLTDLELEFDPALLPQFRPTGTANLLASAADLLVPLEGPVVFDGAGRARVDAVVTNYGYRHPIDLTLALE